MVSSGVTFSNIRLFEIEFNLTLEGEENYEKIIKIFYSYIKLLKNKNEEKKISEIYEEVKMMKNVNFQYKDKSESINLVSILSNKMQSIKEKENLLSSSDIIYDINKKEIIELIKYFDPENIIIIYSSKENEKIVNKKEYWYQTSYHEEILSDDYLNLLRNVDLNDKLFLPKENPFIPKNLFIKLNDLKVSHPILIKSNDNIKIWVFLIQIFYLKKK
jgi:insulysin